MACRLPACLGSRHWAFAHLWLTVSPLSLSICTAYRSKSSSRMWLASWRPIRSNSRSATLQLMRVTESGWERTFRRSPGRPRGILSRRRYSMKANTVGWESHTLFHLWQYYLCKYFVCASVVMRSCSVANIESHRQAHTHIHAGAAGAQSAEDWAGSVSNLIPSCGWKLESGLGAGGVHSPGAIEQGINNPSVQCLSRPASLNLQHIVCCIYTCSSVLKRHVFSLKRRHCCVSHFPQLNMWPARMWSCHTQWSHASIVHQETHTCDLYIFALRLDCTRKRTV